MRFEVVIIGGGIIGLSTALGLSSNNIKVAVIEKEKLPSSKINSQLYEGRVSALNNSSKMILSSLNIWDDITKVRYSNYNEIQLFDKTTKSHTFFKGQDYGLKNLGSIIENRVLTSVLLKKLHSNKKNKVAIFESSNIIYIRKNFSSTDINIANVGIIKTKLLIGADGSNSFIRKYYNFICTSNTYMQHAITCTVKMSNPSAHVAYQYFFDNSIIAFLPLNNNYFSIVWSSGLNNIQRLMKLNSFECAEKLQSITNKHLGKIKVLSGKHIFILKEIHLHSYYKEGVVILGDAAHTIHPLAGQGMNLGLSDVSELINTIVCARNANLNFASSDVLSKYDRRRRLKNELILRSMGVMKHSFCSNQIFFKGMRKTGMHFVNNSSLIKNFFIKAANM